MSYFVNSRAIRLWADHIGARFTLPQVIRRLAHATLRDASLVDFPANESAQRSGFDGKIVCATGNAWVPAGSSVWELGVNHGVKGKADDDFAKRLEETEFQTRQTTAYVFLTPRHWEHKKQWAEDRKGDWKEVHAYDADDLEQWLEVAPTVAAWFGRLIGTRPPGVDDIAARWDALSRCATRPLIPKVFLAGRRGTIDELRAWIGRPPDHLCIQSRSPGEVIDFFCAATAEMAEPERLMVEARSIVVEQLDAWKMLRDAHTPAILVVDPAVTVSSEEVARAISNGHHVLLGVEPGQFTTSKVVALDARGNSNSLKHSKSVDTNPSLPSSLPVPAGEASPCSSTSLRAFKHRRFRFGAQLYPPACSRHVYFSGDGMARTRRIEPRSKPSHVKPTVPVKQICTLWRHRVTRCSCTSQVSGDSFPRTTPGLCSEVGSQHQPSRLLKHSRPRSLPTMTRDTYCRKPSGRMRSCTDTSRNTPKRLGNTSPKRSRCSAASTSFWKHRYQSTSLRPLIASLRRCSRQLRLGIGGRPLNPVSPYSRRRAHTRSCALREDLQRSTPETVKLMHEEQDGFFGRCNHSGLLWALEGLAWSKQYLPEVSQLLLMLSAQDPGGRAANRPKNSLCEILSYWMPYTTASVEERIQVLDLLIRCNREAAWPVLMNLLPSLGRGMSMPTHTPYWRDWANEWHRGATNADSIAFVTATSVRVVTEAGLDADRWHEVFANLGDFYFSVHDQLLEGADALSGSDIPETQRKRLTDELSKQIHRHRSHPNADFRLPTEFLDKLEVVLGRLQPQATSLRHAWLFQAHPEQFMDREGSVAEKEAALEAARQGAIEDIIVAEGFTGIDTLLAYAKHPAFVGSSLALHDGDRFLKSIIPVCLDDDDARRGFALGFIRQRFHSDGWKWADEAVRLCKSARAKGRFLSVLPFNADTWNRVDAAGDEVRQLFWESCRAFNPSLESGDVERTVQCLVAHNRPMSAIDVLSMAVHQNRPITTSILFLPLESLLRSGPGDLKEDFQDDSGYGIQQIIGVLQERNDIEAKRLAGIEFGYLRLLDGHSGGSPKILHTELATSPEFFVEVLSLCYRAHMEGAEEEKTPPTDEQRRFGERAIRLLLDWARVPGSTADGKVDEAGLRAWCLEARRLAKESGRLEVCDDHIGQVFANAPSDENGCWPCKQVRAVIEEIHTDSLLSGWFCGIRNSRGAGFRARGGNQERNLAGKYRKHAEELRFESPIVAKILDEVADSYEREGKRWDARGDWEH